MSRPPLLLAGATLAAAAVVTTAAPGAAQHVGDARAGPDTVGVTRRGVDPRAVGSVAAGSLAGVMAGAVGDAGAAAGSDARAVGRPASTALVVEGVDGVDGRARWRWPLLPRPPVLRPFRAPTSEYGRGHRGLDLATAVGAPVLAVESGVVTHSGVVAGRGTVTVQHAGGLSSTYEPVLPSVGPGDVVTVGDRVGTVEPRAGPGHCGVRVCLHLGARRGDAYLDPHPLLVAGRVRLLPLE